MLFFCRHCCQPRSQVLFSSKRGDHIQIDVDLSQVGGRPVSFEDAQCWQKHWDSIWSQFWLAFILNFVLLDWLYQKVLSNRWRDFFLTGPYIAPKETMSLGYQELWKAWNPTTKRCAALFHFYSRKKQRFHESLRSLSRDFSSKVAWSSERFRTFEILSSTLQLFLANELLTSLYEPLERWNRRGQVPRGSEHACPPKTRILIARHPISLHVMRIFNFLFSLEQIRGFTPRDASCLFLKTW